MGVDGGPPTAMPLGQQHAAMGAVMVQVFQSVDQVRDTAQTGTDASKRRPTPIISVSLLGGKVSCEIRR